MSLPQKISPCPIIDALVEIRFLPKTHPNAVFGLIYNVLQQDFEKVENLPILQLPDGVRSSDPNLKYKPHYKISSPSENFIVQIGPKVLTISSHPEYVGWELFSSKIFDVLTKVQTINIINLVIRIGIRYINFFNDDIFNNINLDVRLNGNIIDYKNTVIRTEIEQDKFNSTLQIANNTNNKGKLGSIIDIDTFLDNKLDSFFDNKKQLINTGHLNEKELFFSLLKDNYLKSLNPEY